MPKINTRRSNQHHTTTSFTVPCDSRRKWKWKRKWRDDTCAKWGDNWSWDFLIPYKSRMLLWQLLCHNRSRRRLDLINNIRKHRILPCSRRLNGPSTSMLPLLIDIFLMKWRFYPYVYTGSRDSIHTDLSTLVIIPTSNTTRTCNT